MDRSDDLIATITRLRSDVDELQRLGASRWGSPSPNSAWGAVPGCVKSSTSNQAGIGASADITFATATLTAVVGRLYRVTLSVLPRQVTSTGTQTLDIETGVSGSGTILAINNTPGVVATLFGVGQVVAYFTGSGSVSVHARAAVTAGTITIESATVKGWFVVEDASLA